MSITRKNRQKYKNINYYIERKNLICLMPEWRVVLKKGLCIQYKKTPVNAKPLRVFIYRTKIRYQLFLFSFVTGFIARVPGVPFFDKVITLFGKIIVYTAFVFTECFMFLFRTFCVQGKFSSFL